MEARWAPRNSMGLWSRFCILGRDCRCSHFLFSLFLWMNSTGLWGPIQCTLCSAQSIAYLNGATFTQQAPCRTRRLTLFTLLSVTTLLMQTTWSHPMDFWGGSAGFFTKFWSRSSCRMAICLFQTLPSMMGSNISVFPHTQCMIQHMSPPWPTSIPSLTSLHSAT